MPPRVAPAVTFRTVPGLPWLDPGDDLVAALVSALREGPPLAPHDVVVVTSKVVSRTEGRVVHTADGVPTARAERLAARTGHDATFVSWVLSESDRVSRVAPGVLVTRHRQGSVSANAGIDHSNVGPPEGDRILLLPVDPDASARRIRDGLEAGLGVAPLGVIISDSLGRPFRRGTVGAAIGAAGVPALVDHRGTKDMTGRTLQHTETALADQLAASADLLAGQAAEGRPVTVVSGVTWTPDDRGARVLVRHADEDLFLGPDLVPDTPLPPRRKRAPGGVVVLSGGVGGARLVDGLARVLDADRLTVVANPGDDLWFWGLRICPDLDTLTYTLAGRADAARGWGRAGERFRALETMRELGAESWFGLGDRDLGLHLRRTTWWHEGVPLSEITQRITAAFGVGPSLWPASETPWETRIETADGVRSFQEWLVRDRAPPVRAIRFEGRPIVPAAVLEAIENADLIVLPPSNPFVSIDPILNLPGVRERVAARPVIAVSPLVAGRAVKGPLADTLRDLVIGPDAPLVPSLIVDHYGSLIDRFVIEADDPIPSTIPVLSTATVMHTIADRVRLAREVLMFAGLRL